MNKRLILKQGKATIHIKIYAVCFLDQNATCHICLCQREWNTWYGKHRKRYSVLNTYSGSLKPFISFIMFGFIFTMNQSKWHNAKFLLLPPCRMRMAVFIWGIWLSIFKPIFGCVFRKCEITPVFMCVRTIRTARLWCLPLKKWALNPKRWLKKCVRSI